MKVSLPRHTSDSAYYVDYLKIRTVYKQENDCTFLVRSALLYCKRLSLWRPYQLNDMEALEKIQRRATKYILSDYISDYKTRLTWLGILLLTYVFEIADIMFLTDQIY